MPEPATAPRCSNAKPIAPARTPKAWATSPTAPARRSRQLEEARCPILSTAATHHEREARNWVKLDLTAIDADIQTEVESGSRGSRGERVAEPGDGGRPRIYAPNVRAGIRSASRCRATRQITYMQATLEALAPRWPPTPTIFVLGEGIGVRGGNFNTTSRASYAKHRRGTPARYADLRARLRRPRLRRRHDRHPALSSTSCSPTSCSTASARSSTRSRRCSTCRVGGSRCRSCSAAASASATPPPRTTRATTTRSSRQFPGLRRRRAIHAVRCEGSLVARAAKQRPRACFSSIANCSTLKGPVPEGDYEIPFGKAADRARRQGRDRRGVDADDAAGGGTGRKASAKRRHRD